MPPSKPFFVIEHFNVFITFFNILRHVIPHNGFMVSEVLGNFNVFPNTTVISVDTISVNITCIKDKFIQAQSNMITIVRLDVNTINIFAPMFFNTFQPTCTTDTMSIN